MDCRMLRRRCRAWVARYDYDAQTCEFLQFNFVIGRPLRSTRTVF